MHGKIVGACMHDRLHLRLQTRLHWQIGTPRTCTIGSWGSEDRRGRPITRNDPCCYSLARRSPFAMKGCVFRSPFSRQVACVVVLLAACGGIPACRILDIIQDATIRPARGLLQGLCAESAVTAAEKQDCFAHHIFWLLTVYYLQSQREMPSQLPWAQFARPSAPPSAALPVRSWPSRPHSSGGTTHPRALHRRS
jgi:hypothetical protein